MKYKGYCDSPADNRGVYVEASSREEAIEKMTIIIMAVYGCDKEQVSLYKIADELENPGSVLQFECGWAVDDTQAWDDDPIIAYESNSEAMRAWADTSIMDVKEDGMLILSRRIGETIVIGDNTNINVMGAKGGQVRLGVDAPKEVPVHREEIYQRIQKEKNTQPIANKEAKKPKVTVKRRRKFTIFD